MRIFGTDITQDFTYTVTDQNDAPTIVTTGLTEFTLDENIPFVRMGFPIYDRVGHSYFPLVGYKGALRLLEKILTVLMDKIDRESTEEKFELVM